MDTLQFWELIEKTTHFDTEQQYQHILDALSTLSPKEVCRFGQFVGLYAERSESPAIYIACKLLNGSASDDTELYFRYWLLARGREIFFGTLKNPDKLAEVKIKGDYCEFEMLMGAAYTVLDEMVDNAEQAMELYVLADKEVKEIIAEIETDMEWPEDEEDLWNEANVRAPKLFAKYHSRAEKFEQDISLIRSSIAITPSAQMPCGSLEIGGAFGGRVEVIGENGKRGIINKKGDTAIPLLYEEICEGGFRNGFVSVKRNGLWGAVDKKGIVVVEFLYESSFLFSEGFAFVKKGGRFAVVDVTGSLRTDFIYDCMSLYHNGRAIVTIDGKSGILDEKAVKILPPLYTQIEPYFNYSFTLAINYQEGQPMKVGYLDRNGNVIVPIIYENIIQDNRYPEKTMGILNGQKILLDMTPFVVERP